MDNQASEDELRTLDDILSQAFTDGASDTMWLDERHVEIFATAKKELETLIRTEKLKLLAEVREQEYVVIGEQLRGVPYGGRAMSMKLGEINRQAAELFNGLPDEDRKKAGLGYSLGQHTTIVQLRIKNKEAYQNYDRKLAEWQKNIEKHILREYLSTSDKLKEK